MRRSSGESPGKVEENGAQPSLQKFRNLTKRLIKVPREEVVDAERSYKAERQRSRDD